jgi:eukaryotic-like serine/threonine-protein kinase
MEALLDEKEEALALADEKRSLLERSTPPELPPDQPQKAALIAAREQVRTLREELAGLPFRIQFHYQQSLAIAADENVRSLEARFFRDQMLRAEAQGDEAAARGFAALLAGSAGAADLAGSGHLTLWTQPHGARATLYRYVRRPDGRMQADRDQPVDLGVTPVSAQPLAAGRYLVELAAEGHATSRYPVRIERGQHWGHASWHGGKFREKDWTVRLVRAPELGKGEWIHVPAGPYRATASAGVIGLSPALEWRWEDDFAIGRTEVTLAEYWEFLESPAAADSLADFHDKDPQGIPPIVPRTVAMGEVTYVFTYDSGAQELSCPRDGELPEWRRRPVSGVSGRGVLEFIDWRRSCAGGATIDLPTGSQWEKAARGVDGRPFPWGDEFDLSFTSGRFLAPGETHLLNIGRPAGSFPHDESPYGALDMSGNVQELARGAPRSGDTFEVFWCCGGNFGARVPESFVTWPFATSALDNSGTGIGWRLARKR